MTTSQRVGAAVVAGLVTLSLAACGEAVPAHVDELATVGLTATPAYRVRPPRIAEAPVAFECTVDERILTTSRQVYLGRIRHLHAADGLVDTERYADQGDALRDVLLSWWVASHG